MKLPLFERETDRIIIQQHTNQTLVVSPWQAQKYASGIAFEPETKQAMSDYQRFNSRDEVIQSMASSIHKKIEQVTKKDLLPIGYLINTPDALVMWFAYSQNDVARVHYFIWTSERVKVDDVATLNPSQQKEGLQRQITIYETPEVNAGERWYYVRYPQNVTLPEVKQALTEMLSFPEGDDD